MVCEQCKKRAATVHLTKIINDQKTVINLCEECAGGYHDLSPFSSNFSIHKLLTSLLEQSEGPHLMGYRKPEITCQQCGLTLNQFSHYGKLGCDKCYSAFTEHIKPLLRKVHGSNHHLGKVPRRTGLTFLIKRDVEKLKNELQELIQQEEFEKAAQIRDKIREMEKKLN